MLDQKMMLKYILEEDNSKQQVLYNVSFKESLPNVLAAIDLSPYF